MLVLSRRPQESIVIDGNIRVTIIKSASGGVRLGIDAPADVAVHREEVQRQINQETICERGRCPDRKSTPGSAPRTGTESRLRGYPSSPRHLRG